MNKKKPQVTVVTVCYNAVNEIERTMLSVLGQMYRDIEYIIIDGGSTDGTVDIIKKYANRLAFWVSEHDEGIYDAMNKGIRYATGEWINFMNSGDYFSSDAVFSDIFGRGKNYDGVGVVYGNVSILEKWGTYEETPENLSLMTKRFPFCHQSAFARTELMKKHLFDTRYSICADYKFFYDAWKGGTKFQYINLTVSCFNHSIDSQSGQNRLAVIHQNLAISETTFATLKYTKMALRYWIGRICYFILPYSIIVKKRRHHVEKSPKTISVSWKTSL